MNRDDTQDLFDRTLDRLEQRVRLQKIIRWTRDPAGRRRRLPLGILCLIGSLFWFLPVLGLWLLPIGLVLIAHDVPRLRNPVARFVIWIESRCIALARLATSCGFRSPEPCRRKTRLGP